jgi:hypothetical protein
MGRSADRQHSPFISNVELLEEAAFTPQGQRMLLHGATELIGGGWIDPTICGDSVFCVVIHEKAHFGSVTPALY